MLFVFVLILCALIAFFLYVQKCNNYWSQRGVVTVETNYIFGVALDFITGRRSVESTFSAIYAAEPNQPYVGIYNLLQPVLFIRDLDLIHRITVTDFKHFHDRQKALKTSSTLTSYSVSVLGGEAWKTTRNKLVPTFSGSKLKGMHGMIEDCADILAEQLFRPFAKAGQPVAVKESMARFTLDVIGTCAFGLRFNSLNDSNSFYRSVAEIVNESSYKKTIRLLSNVYPNLSAKLGVRTTTEQLECFFTDLLRTAQVARLKESEHRGDFLQLMLDLKENGTDKAHDLFTEKHIIANMFTFYFAGHETTSLTLTFALYELATHPDVQDKLRGEIGKVAEENGGILDYTAINKIAYLEMVITETLRLHAPASTSVRMCTETYHLPDSKVTLKPGDSVQFSISALHTDEKYYPRPMEFDPDRWSEENADEMNPNAYMPFGGGPRICLGMRFARLEIKIGLVKILTRFKLSPCDKTEVPIILKKSGTFHAPQNEVWLSVVEV